LASARYKAGRSNDQLKVKPQDDAEAKVIGHVADVASTPKAQVRCGWRLHKANASN